VKGGIRNGGKMRGENVRLEGNGRDISGRGEGNVFDCEEMEIL
jgi:hypothetical protein